MKGFKSLNFPSSISQNTNLTNVTDNLTNINENFSVNNIAALSIFLESGASSTIEWNGSVITTSTSGVFWIMNGIAQDSGFSIYQIHPKGSAILLYFTGSEIAPTLYFSSGGNLRVRNNRSGSSAVRILIIKIV